MKTSYRIWLLFVIITVFVLPSCNSTVTGERGVKTRKQVCNLTLDDLTRFPVWEFALDEEGEEGQDEATVRPYQFTPPLNPNDEMFVVLAEFTLADGTRMQGYFTPPVQGAGGISTFQPIIITEQGQVGFWYGIRKPDAETISEDYHLLDKTASQVFPVMFRSMVEIRDGSVEGTLDGFLYFKRDESRPLELRDMPIDSIR
jgi:hypothetical protein